MKESVDISPVQKNKDMGWWWSNFAIIHKSLGGMVHGDVTLSLSALKANIGGTPCQPNYLQ